MITKAGSSSWISFSVPAYATATGPVVRGGGHAHVVGHVQRYADVVEVQAGRGKEAAALIIPRTEHRGSDFPWCCQPGPRSAQE
ncbi:hypothetical protein, partial [Streptomyces sp. NRRL WC-3549]|uniref:hypothetical protein n=1 Tax=Streptomyces sp. NRRL WC-3549 TaxID=1463925 RepID=UPI0004C71211